MAIALDTNAALGSTSTSPSAMAYTCTGANRLLLVFIYTTGAADVVTGVTYAGAGMTQLVKVTAPDGTVEYVYGLLAPATGSNTIAISFSAGTVHAVATSYTGVLQSGLPDATASGTQAAGPASFAQAITTVADNCWVATCCENGAATPTASTNITSRSPQDVLGVGDSNGAVTPAGSFSQTWTVNTGGGSAMLQVSFAPVPPTALPTGTPKGGAWPNPVRRVVNPGADRGFGFVQESPLALLTWIPPPPFFQTDWPNPVRRISDHAMRDGFVRSTPPWTIPDFSSALIYITVNGIARAYGRDEANGSIDAGSLSIQDTLNQTPNTAQFTARGFTPTVGMRVIMALGGIDNPSRLFSGTILTVHPIYVGTPENQTFQVSCIDDTWLLNKTKVIKTYTSQSASAIAQDLLQTYAPGFTWRHVDPSLDTIDLITFTNENLDTCFTRLAKRAGVDWKIDEFDDLWFGTEGDGIAPVDLTEVHPSLESGSFTSTTDLTEIITRSLVEGGGVNALAAIDPGETILPVLDVDGWYNALGGTVVVGTQRLTYTGVQAGGDGSLVGPGIGPSSPPTLALAAGAGVESGAHQYAVVFRTTDDTTLSLPSPVASITVGLETPPETAPIAGSPTTGGSVDAGDHAYVVTFVNAAGETTPSPVSNTVSILQGASDPAAIGTLASFADASGSLSNPGAYHWAFTFRRDADGAETALSPVTSPGGANWGGNYARIDLTGCTSAPAGFTRTWYRTAMDGTTYKRVPVSGHNVNGEAGKPSGVETAGFFYDDCADGALGATAPASNQTTFETIPLTAIPLGGSSVTSRKLYRTVAGGSVYKLVDTLNATDTTYSDTTADAALGATVPASNTATANRVSLTNIPIGASAVTRRWLYRTVTGGAQLKYLATIADNTTTTYTDLIADASLTTDVPTSDTSGLTQPDGQIIAGSTTLLSAGVGWASSSGGWAVIGNGRQVIRYTGISGNTLTGIPATGTGAITASIAYNSTITNAPSLTGIPRAAVLSASVSSGMGQWSHLLVAFAPATGSSIAFDAVTNGGSGVASYSHTTSGANRRLFVCIETLTPDTISAVTYGGIGMRLLPPVWNALAIAWTWIAVLDAPATGANTVVITGSLTGFFDSCAISYTGCAQTGTVDALHAQGNTLDAVTRRAQLTPVADNCWLLMATVDGNGSVILPGLGTTVRKTTSGGGFTVYDSNGPVVGGNVGAITATIPSGDPVNLLVQVDDIAAQAVLSALLDPTDLLGGAAGIREDYLQDGRISETEARARGTAHLALLSRAQTSVTYTCRDPLTASGRNITIDLPSPTSIDTVLMIQQVMISKFSASATLFPTYAVQASSIRFSFEDLLRQTRQLLNG